MVVVAMVVVGVDLTDGEIAERKPTPAPASAITEPATTWTGTRLPPRAYTASGAFRMPASGGRADIAAGRNGTAE